jgi:N-acetylglucosamine kinase-like BadF-type ATPase
VGLSGIGGPTQAPLILGVDGGNSKTAVLVADADGRLIGRADGPTVSHERVGLERGVARLGELVDEARSGAPRPAVGVFALAGADFPGDVRRLTAAIRARGLADDVRVVNDSWAGLRAGTDRGWGIVLISGSGVTAAGLAPSGRRYNLPSIGAESGDWGGGVGIGQAALRAANRAVDGRGPRTVLTRLVPEHFGMARPLTLARAVHEDRLDDRRLGELAPIVFAAATAGDAVARSIVDRVADELTVTAAAMARRLGLVRRRPDVVLAGGVFRATDDAFYHRLTTGIRVAIPGATIRRAGPPVLGAALLSLDAAPGLTDRRRRAAAEALRTAIGRPEDPG